MNIIRHLILIFNLWYSCNIALSVCYVKLKIHNTYMFVCFVLLSMIYIILFLQWEVPKLNMLQRLFSIIKHSKSFYKYFFSKSIQFIILLASGFEHYSSLALKSLYFQNIRFSVIYHSPATLYVCLIYIW